MTEKETWIYVRMPVFIARYNKDTLEVLRLDDNTWYPAKDPHMWVSIETDGTVVSKEEALQAHDIYRKQFL